MDCYTKFFIEPEEGESDAMRQSRETVGRALIRSWMDQEHQLRRFEAENQWDERDGGYSEHLFDQAFESLRDEDIPEGSCRIIEAEKIADKWAKERTERCLNAQAIIERQLEAIGYRKGDVFEEYNEEAPYWRMMEQRAVDRDGRW